MIFKKTQNPIKEVDFELRLFHNSQGNFNTIQPLYLVRFLRGHVAHLEDDDDADDDSKQ